MEDLKFSVVIPVFNMAGTIGDSIKSVLNQTYQNFEIIVQDNDSNDGTAEVVRSFRDPRINYFKNKTNLGVRNFIEGWKNCHGDILYYLAADDILAKNALKETSAAFMISENIGAVTRPYFWFHDDINIPVRITPTLNSNKDEVVSIRDFRKAIVAVHNEVLGQISGLAFRMKYIQESFFSPEDEWIAHGHPFLYVFKKYPIVMLKNFQVAVRIGTSGIRQKNNSAYNISPTKRWVAMINKILSEKENQKFKEYYIKNIIATNFIGLVQIKGYSKMRYLLREIWYLLKYKPLNMLDIKFWFFSIGCIVTPSSVLVRMVDLYKKYIHSRIIKKVDFEYDISQPKSI